MTRPGKRFRSEQELCDEIDKLKDEVPVLYEWAVAARQEVNTYLANINDHMETYRQEYKRRKVTEEEHPNFTYKKLKREAQRLAAKPKRWENKLKKLSEALAEFRTERMPFLTDQSVEVK